MVTHTTERHPQLWHDNAAGTAAAVQTLALLADATRLRLLYLLTDGERGVSDLERITGLPQPTVSHHLGLLRRARLVQARREGRQVFYRLTHPAAVPGVLSVPTDGGAITLTLGAMTEAGGDRRAPEHRADAA